MIKEAKGALGAAQAYSSAKAAYASAHAVDQAAEIRKLQKLVKSQQAEMSTYKKRLTMLAKATFPAAQDAAAGPQQTPQEIADAWEKKNFHKWGKEAHDFKAKLMTLKQAAKRKHIARVATARWLSEVKLVDDSADDLRRAKV